MTHLVRLLLFAAWIVGAVTGGLTVPPDATAPPADVRLVAESDWTRLTVQSDRVVLAVGKGDHSWRAAAPLPAFVHKWLHAPDDSPRPSPLATAVHTPL